MRLFTLAALALLCAPLLLTAQDAQPAPPAERTLELHLHALSRGYMRPLRATTERLAAVPGLKNVEVLGYGGDVMRFRATTALNDDAVAAALGLQLMGARGTRLVLAADARSPRAVRAEARGVLMQIAAAINALPKPKYGGGNKAVFGDADTTEKKLKLLGLDPALLAGVNYKPADYKIVEQASGWSSEYQLWAGKAWTPAGVVNEGWGPRGRVIVINETGEREEGAPKVEERWVGVSISRSPWNDGTSWVDAEGMRMEGLEGDRGETNSDGKLRVQEGAEWMTSILKKAVAHRLREAKPNVRKLPQGRGWGLFDKIDAENLNRWEGTYSSDCLNLSWTVRPEDKHYIARLTAHHAGHAFYLEAEVDADTVYAQYKDKGEDLSKIAEVELGDALKWVVGAETGPEVFAERRKEAAAGMDAIMAALGRLAPEQALALPSGPDWAKAAGFDFAGIETKHFKAQDYQVARQALGDFEIAVGAPMTGGRWWMLCSPQTGKVIRSEK